jgi:uncharacterized protein (TIGR02271 family)
MFANINWDDVIKKEARGSDGYDLGEVQEVTSEFVLTQKGVVDKKRFEIPKKLVKDFDGNKLVLDVTELDAKNSYLQNKSDSDNNEQTIPLIKEELEPKKYEKEVKATIVKEPIKETSQVDLELTHEELVIERRPLAEPRKTDEEAVQSRTEIKIPLKRQEVEVNKQSYVTEEIIAKKKPVTETTTVSEEVITEKLKNQSESQPAQDPME